MDYLERMSVIGDESRRCAPFMVQLMEALVHEARVKQSMQIVEQNFFERNEHDEVPSNLNGNSIEEPNFDANAQTW